MKVTVDQLTKLNACRVPVDLFIKTFGQEVEVTEANCLIAARAGIDIDWAAQKLLTPKQKQAYKDAEAPLWQAYEDAEAPLLQAYKDAEAQLWQAYKDARAPLLQAYKDAEAPLLQAYEDARAVEFFKASQL